MKRLIFRSLVVVAAAAVFSTSASHEAKAGNVIVNGSFEAELVR